MVGIIPNKNTLTENVNKITQDSSLLGEHIQTIDSAMKEVESSNRQLVENMEFLETTEQENLRF